MVHLKFVRKLSHLKDSYHNKIKLTKINLKRFNTPPQTKTESRSHLQVLENRTNFLQNLLVCLKDTDSRFHSRTQNQNPGFGRGGIESTF